MAGRAAVRCGAARRHRSDLSASCSNSRWCHKSPASPRLSFFNHGGAEQSVVLARISLSSNKHITPTVPFIFASKSERISLKLR